MEDLKAESKEEEEHQAAPPPFRVPNIELPTHVGDVDSVVGSEHPFGQSPARSPPKQNMAMP